MKIVEQYKFCTINKFSGILMFKREITAIAQLLIMYLKKLSNSKIEIKIDYLF